MEKLTVIKISEREILDLINECLDLGEESIVELEELGNQDWVVQVSPRCIDEYSIHVVDCKRKLHNWRTRDALNHLCWLGILEAGEYVIDCTW